MMAIMRSTDLAVWPTVVARLDRATQYAVASRFNHDLLWDTGSPD